MCNKKTFLILCKGFIVGSAMLIPGISGGTTAILLNIYDDLIHAVSSLRKHPGKSIRLLSVFALGGILGVFFLAKPMLYLMESFPFPMRFFLMGVVLGGIPLLYRKANVSKFSFTTILYPIFGVLVIIAISFIPPSFLIIENMSYLLRAPLLFVIGLFIAIALILPGISLSYLLLILGIYEITVSAIIHLDFGYLLPLSIGVLLGIMMTAKLLSKWMDQYKTPTYLIILGFVAASILELFPGIPLGQNLWSCLLLFILGFIFIWRFYK